MFILLEHNNGANYHDQRLRAIAQTKQEQAVRAARTFECNQEVFSFTTNYDIPQAMVTFGSMNAYEYQLHTEWK